MTEKERDNTTHIRIKVSDLKELRKHRLHSKETDADVLKRILKVVKDESKR